VIGDLQVLDGFASKLPRLCEPISFKPGLNVLFGPNGCGKSTTLKILAAYCSISGGGWSRHQDPGTIFPISYGKKKCDCSLPYSYFRISPAKCKAKMEWDGTATLFADASVTDQTSWTHFFYEKKDSPDGMSDLNEQLGVMYGRPSSGQLRLHKLAKYYESMKKPPKLNEISPKLGRV
jgi:energy-coupling factor transporter ATP-binding protein EcfA2